MASWSGYTVSEVDNCYMFLLKRYIQCSDFCPITDTEILSMHSHTVGQTVRLLEKSVHKIETYPNPGEN
jgi:hypothetical protein